jgi:hypothetical protein
MRDDTDRVAPEPDAAPAPDLTPTAEAGAAVPSTTVTRRSGAWRWLWPVANGWILGLAWLVMCVSITIAGIALTDPAAALYATTGPVTVLCQLALLPLAMLSLAFTSARSRRRAWAAGAVWLLVAGLSWLGYMLGWAAWLAASAAGLFVVGLAVVVLVLAPGLVAALTVRAGMDERRAAATTAETETAETAAEIATASVSSPEP